MARARCGIGCEYTVYSGYLPWSFISLLPCSILSSRNPSPARFLPPAAHASPRSFLACSHHQPFLPSTLPSPTDASCLCSILASSLPPLTLSLPLLSLPPLFPSPTITLLPPPPSPPSFPPSVPPTFYSPSPLPCLTSSLPPSLPTLAPSVPPTFYSPALLPCPSLPACLLPCNSIYTVCVYTVLASCTGYCLWRAQPWMALRQWRGRAISRWLAVTLATHPHHESVFDE